MIQALLSAQEDERRRIARELHDNVNQALAATIISLERLAGLSDAPPPIRTGIRSVVDRLGELSDFLRDLAHALRPAALEHAGLKAALEVECAEFSRREGVPVRFAARGPLEAIPKVVEETLFRVAQESLRNVARHARARRANVALIGSPGGVRLSIRDNGVGFASGKTESDGIGILNMQERMRLVGGRLAVRSRPGGGSRVEAIAPLGGDRR
jgi:signal transduction histidine kinase